jgi:aminomethyltransferase
MLNKTPFHSRLDPLCQSYEWRRWAGYIVASKYELTHDREYTALRNGAGLIDITPLYKYRVTGRDAPRFLDRIMTRHISRGRVGRVMYTLWCDDQGYVREDGTVARLGDHDFRITAAEPNMHWFQMNKGGLDVQVVDETEQIAALALQGPRSREILVQATGNAVADLRYFRLMNATISGCPVIITRTGFTGDLGYELWLAAEDAEPIWDALITAGEGYGLLPTGMVALDMARIEAGLVLIDVDYTPAQKAFIPAQKSSPYDLSLDWTVDMRKPVNFIGRQALTTIQKNGPEWRLVGIEINWPALEAVYAQVNLPPQVPHTPWRKSIPLYTTNGREAGYATSGCFSPILKRYIALATVKTQYAQTGTRLQMEITVEHMRRRAAAKVVKTPFFDPQRKRF